MTACGGHEWGTRCSDSFTPSVGSRVESRVVQPLGVEVGDTKTPSPGTPGHPLDYGQDPGGVPKSVVCPESSLSKVPLSVDMTMLHQGVVGRDSGPFGTKERG